ncbi:MAG: tRNA-intron lyase [Nanoarchaeota archaeon]
MVEKKIVDAFFLKENVITNDSDLARELYNKNVFGFINESKKIELSFIEAFYLLQKKKIKIFDLKNKEVNEDLFLKKVLRKDKLFWTKFFVFKDLRDRGYIVKTALKFGADFRVYDRGVKPGEDHAKWVVFAVSETSILTWHEFSAKNRVAHSTKKRLLLAVVDCEGDVSYWESRWIKP